MNNKEYNIYKKIFFLERYEQLSSKFQTENEFKYSTEKILNIVANFGYNFQFVKKYNFFKFKEQLGLFEFYIHFSIKYNLIEIIIGANDTLTNEFITGGTFGNLYKDIKYFQTNEEYKVNKPCFKNYKDLENILKEVLSIYEDFKAEVLKIC